jgi:hypothetical protein
MSIPSPLFGMPSRSPSPPCIANSSTALAPAAYQVRKRRPPVPSSQTVSNDRYSLASSNSCNHAYPVH